MAINKNFVVKNGLEVADNLLFADGSKQRVGIGTTVPNYSLDVRGGIAVTGGVFLPPEQQPLPTTGTVDAATPFLIVGVNTSLFRVNDLVDDGPGGVIGANTKVTNIGITSIGIFPGHTRFSGTQEIPIIITRNVTSGEENQILVSRGPNLPPTWKIPSGETIIEENDEDQTNFLIFASGAGSTTVNVDLNGLSYNPFLNRLGIGTNQPTEELTVIGDVSISNNLNADSLISNSAVISNTQIGTSDVELFVDGDLLVTGISTFGPDENITIYGSENKIQVGLEVTVSDYEINVGPDVVIGTSGVVTATEFVGNLTGVASTSESLDIVSISSTEKYYPTFVAGIGQTIVGITTNKIHFIPDSGFLGIGTDQARFSFDVIGDVGIEGQIYAATSPEIYSTRLATLSGTNRSIIGIDTSGISIGDLIDEAPFAGVNFIPANTLVSSIGIGTIGISNQHNYFSSTPITFQVDLFNIRFITPGKPGNVLVSQGQTGPVIWKKATDLLSVGVSSATQDLNFSLVFTPGESEFGTADLRVNSEGIVFNPSTNSLGIGTTNPQANLDVYGDVSVAGTITADLFVGTATTAETLLGIANTSIDVIGGIASVTELNVSGDSIFNDVTAGIVTANVFFGDGVNLAGIVTQITAGIGIELTPSTGLGKVEIQAYTPAGKTIFVNQNGDDNNSGLTENDAKRTVKSAASIALFGDTIKVFPGAYIEDNPIVLNPTVSVEGAELRNCVITPKNPSKDLFYVNNGCHITNLSYIGQESRDGAAIVALQPLLGTQVDRYFDAARIIRYNLDFIAAEAVGFLTSTDYQNPPFELDGSDYSSCKDDVKDVFKAVIHDITRGGNSRCVGAGLSYYSDDTLQHIVGVKTETIDTFQFAIGIAHSCINNVLWEGNYQDKETQVRDLSIQPDPLTGSNVDINSCSNVLSAVQTCVGIVTTIIDLGPSAGIVTTFPGNSGIGFTTLNRITNASYDEKSGKVTLTVPDYSAKVGDIVEIRDLEFECSSNGSPIIQKFPSGKFGYEFYIERINANGSFDVYVGISSIPHTYVSGTGFLVNRSIEVTGAVYDNTTGITTITAPGAFVKEGDFVILRDLEFSCPSGPAILKYPSGKEGFSFKVDQVIGLGTTFVVTVGTSTLPHTYESGGVVFPPYSRGVGPITQGPYIRNCTNFVPKSIGMKVDGFNAEPGDKDDIGVTGTMSVDSYTQFNQGGIGVSITNGAYSQLVSIFTICSDTAIFTGSGGQCDITNSNSSFGTFGLVSDGVGDAETKSIYRSTGITLTETPEKTNIVEISGVGDYRPYDGQVCYFGELFFFVSTIEVIDGGSGYTVAPRVTISAPEGPNGISAQASSVIQNGRVVAINVVNSGTQYRTPPTVTVDAPGSGITATVAVGRMQPIYYKIDSATLPSAGVSTVSLLQNLNNTVSAGTIVYFSRVSLQITSSHSFEWVGSGNDINSAKPALGGVVIPENEVIQQNGGLVVYTSTDQAGNFKIGDGVIINQATGQISGRDFTKALFTTMTPFILALSE
jgi:hypothetical protein